MNDFYKIASAEKFNSLEKVRGIIIENRPWLDLDLITTSFKKKRHDLTNFYKKEIDALYKEMNN